MLTYMKKKFLNRINEMSTTELGKDRIRKNLQLDENVDVVEYCKNIMKNSPNIMKNENNKHKFEVYQIKLIRKEFYEQ